MDEIEVLTEALNATLQRHGRVAAAYEVEVANLTVEIIRLRSRVEELEALKERDEAQPVKAVSSKS
jgi:hypothetical protein